MSEILYDVREGVAYITLNRPEARNALTFGMYEEIARLCADVKLGGEIKSVVISGAGDKAFAAGTSMDQFRSFSVPQDSIDYEQTMDRVLQMIEQCEVPTIAALTGACTGGGAAIAAACDLRICDAHLKFGFPIARTLGNCLSIGNLNRMSALLGPGRVREIIFTARLVEAQEALDIGLVSEVLPDAPACRERAEELARKMANHAPLTLRSTKEALRRLRVEGPTVDGTDLVVECYMSEDFKEGIEAFLGKRKPQWKGK
ncbi:MAG: enoyl-CoA hydratase/isomerase family protein [Pseudomonadota bacterium]